MNDSSMVSGQSSIGKKETGDGRPIQGKRQRAKASDARGRSRKKHRFAVEIWQRATYLKKGQKFGQETGVRAGGVPPGETGDRNSIAQSAGRIRNCMLCVMSSAFFQLTIDD